MGQYNMNVQSAARSKPSCLDSALRAMRSNQIRAAGSTLLKPARSGRASSELQIKLEQTSANLGAGFFVCVCHPEEVQMHGRRKKGLLWEARLSRAWSKRCRVHMWASRGEDGELTGGCASESSGSRAERDRIHAPWKQKLIGGSLLI